MRTIKLIVVALVTLFLFTACDEAPPDNSIPAGTEEQVLYQEKEELKQAIEVNKDTVAWVSVPGSNIDDPVVQAADNDYYLRRNAQGQDEYTGCVFADYEVDFEDLSKNIVLYGHTFSDGVTGDFAELANYSDEKWAAEHDTILLYLPDETLTFQVYAAGPVSIDESDLPIRPEITATELGALLRYVSLHSDIAVQEPEQAPEQVLTLVTCNDNSNERYLVTAILAQPDNDH